MCAYILAPINVSQQQEPEFSHKVELGLNLKPAQLQRIGGSCSPRKIQQHLPTRLNQVVSLWPEPKATAIQRARFTGCSAKMCPYLASRSAAQVPGVVSLEPQMGNSKNSGHPKSVLRQPSQMQEPCNFPLWLARRGAMMQEMLAPNRCFLANPKENLSTQPTSPLQSLQGHLQPSGS